MSFFGWRLVRDTTPAAVLPPTATATSVVSASASHRDYLARVLPRLAPYLPGLAGASADPGLLLLALARMSDADLASLSDSLGS